MTDWNINWIPQKTAEFEPDWNTLLSPFESGKEQRRQKWSRKKHRFRLSFEAVTDTIADAIRVHYDSVKGRFTNFNFMNFMQRIKGTTLALVDGGGGADTITDSGEGFLLKGFDTNLKVYVNGSTDIGNSVFADIVTVTAGTIGVATGTWASTDSANADLEVYCAYDVRFNHDFFRNNFLFTDVAEVKRIELIEVI